MNRNAISVAIILRDTVVAVGLKHVLRNLFDVDAVLYRSVSDLSQDDAAGNADLLITETAVFAVNLSFFMPRRARLLVLADTDEGDDSSGFLVNRYADEASLIKRITEVFEQVQTSAGTGNDLSQREVDVLCLVASGLTNKEIADRLNISTNTVLSHRKNITAKLGIRSVSGLSVYAMMNGYISV